MACHAILTNSVGLLTGKLCRNYSMNGCNFCYQHREITPEDHKNRWIRKFILAADGKPYMYLYDEHKKTRILGDLKDGIISLTQEDIERIPDRAKYLDIYLLLFENGYIDLENNNVSLYTRSLLYLSEFWSRTERSEFQTLSTLAKRIVDVLILRNADYFSFFLGMVPGLLTFRRFQGERLIERMPSVAAFLLSLLASDAAKQLAWEPLEERLLPQYESLLGSEHPGTVFLRQTYLPAFRTLNNTVKRIQKAWTNQYKEELMAVCWHPDRFMEYCLDEQDKEEFRKLFS